jgi:hypothetical protein
MKSSLGFGWVLVSVNLIACEVSPVDYGSVDRSSPPKPDGGADMTTKGACVPKGETKAAPATDPNAYPACACANGGAARCVPSAEIPSTLASQLDACNGGACVPDTIIESGGAAPPTCESPFGEGRCVSICVPAVGDKASLLDRGKGDVCATDERCVPCKNPLANGESTGVCEIGPSAPAEICEDAVTANAPPPSGGTGACAAPPSCRSVNDSEGRCLPLSLPMVAEQKDLLPASTCGAEARCAPCFHPLTGQPSGACTSVACDSAKEPAKTLKACCESHGRCVPRDAVPESAREELGDDDGTCAANQELCVPQEILPGATTTTPCTVTFPFIGGGYRGVCVSDCFETIVPSGNCPGDLVCAPNQ